MVARVPSLSQAGERSDPCSRSTAFHPLQRGSSGVDSAPIYSASVVLGW